METTKKAYNEIFKLLNKYKEVCLFDISDLERKSINHLYGLELKEIYGFNINPKNVNSTTYNTFFEYIRIYKVIGDEKSRISYSDDGRQPDNEMLVVIYFPCGAYTFCEDYPTDLFQSFFNELKSYNPKYTDSANKTLYFAMDSAKDVFNNFQLIFKKYQDLNKEDYKLRKIAKMKLELEKLENNK